ncbi:MAG: DUF3455 domain-containing protein [Betaproteobacteria bacterium]|nr:DUF3455 domain-containing protein [Betaproteobacteria bacterium]
MNLIDPLIRRHVALAGATLLAACAGGTALVAMPPADVPAAIAAPAGQVLEVAVAARGVQIYECRATPGSAAGTARPEWAFVAPEATLLDAQGRTVGQHGAGPHWTFDGGTPAAARFPGRVTGRVTGRAEAPRAGAIPWLRLDVAAGPGAGGSLGSIQRVNTIGGLAPATPCDTTVAGQRVRVPYTADYRFYAAR